MSKFSPEQERARTRFADLLETIDEGAYECDVDAVDGGIVFVFELSDPGLISLQINDDGTAEAWAEPNEDECEAPLDPSPSLFGPAVFDPKFVRALVRYALGEDMGEED